MKGPANREGELDPQILSTEEFSHHLDEYLSLYVDGCFLGF